MSLIVIVFTNLHCKLGRYHKWIFVAQMYMLKQENCFVEMLPAMKPFSRRWWKINFKVGGFCSFSLEGIFGWRTGSHYNGINCSVSV